MLRRGLLGDPSLVTRVRGGERAGSARLQAFHDTLFARYCDAFGDSRIAVLRMKELWFYFGNLFENTEKLQKSIKKAKMPRNSNVRRRRSFARARCAGMPFRRGSARRNAVRLRAETDYAQYPNQTNDAKCLPCAGERIVFLMQKYQKCRE